MPVSVELFVSLLFIVVIEISGIARSLDLERISESKLPPFFIGLFFIVDSTSPNVGRTPEIPQLGRFNFLHGANLAILYIGFVLVTKTTTGTVGGLVALVTFVVWALLPLLEVDEYENIIMDGYRPVSYYHHVFTVVVSSAYITFFDSLWLPGVLPSNTLLKGIVLAAGCIVLYYISLLGFLSSLERELDREDSNRVPDTISKVS